MSKYNDIKKQVEQKYATLSDEVGLFWAFSNEQFVEGKAKHPIAQGKKYASIGAGGYMPSDNVQQWVDGCKAIEKWRKQAVKQAKADEVILSELKNYEVFYTGEFDDVMEVLEPLGYTYEQVKQVYNANRELVGV